ncbi:hypothetical protein Tco_1447888 [Tanacetum coccineum]
MNSSLFPINNPVKSSEFYSMAKPYSQTNRILVLLHTPKKPGHITLSSSSLMLFVVLQIDGVDLNCTIKKIKCARSNPTTNLPYGMFLLVSIDTSWNIILILTMAFYNVCWIEVKGLLCYSNKVIVEKVPSLHLSNPAHHNHGSSSRQGDDDEDDGDFRANNPITQTSTLIS